MSASEEHLSSQSAGRPARVAVYPGTFDPVHNGHLDVARRAAALFDRLVVAVYDRPAKALLFSPEERIGLFRAGLEAAGVPNVAVERYSELTVEFARRIGALAIVRGLRAAVDFEYEYPLTAMNRHLRPEIETVFLLTLPEFAHLSATLVKEVAAGGADVTGLVPPAVADALGTRYSR